MKYELFEVTTLFKYSMVYARTLIKFTYHNLNFVTYMYSVPSWRTIFWISSSLLSIKKRFT